MSAGSVQVSPLQMKALLFDEVHIQALHGTNDWKERWAPDFKFQDTPIALDVSVSGKPDKKEDEPSREYRVSVRLRVYEEPEASQKPPYFINVCANAWFVVMDDYPADRCLTLVEVNGASLVIGAIREEVARVTSRCHLGTLMLPTLRVVPGAPESEPPNTDQDDKSR